jgi:hypothetical protein
MPDSNPSLFVREPSAAYGTTDVFGETFDSAAERREHFRKQLDAALDEIEDVLGGERFSSVKDVAETLRGLEHWPAPSADWARDLSADMADGDGDLLQRWKDVVGFPEGEREQILELSDPPFFTICPNPFLARFVEHYGTEYEEDDDYDREPFAYDVEESKTGWLYEAHSYHTKVPYKAIVRYLIHYTEPGDIVIDGFAGSGMTGVASRFCDLPDDELKEKIEDERRNRDLGAPKWGKRHTIMQDLGPAATLIAANFNIPFDVEAFRRAGREVLNELEKQIGWMYRTTHSDGRTGKIDFTVWSQILGCPECGQEVVYFDAARVEGSKKKSFSCPHCDANLTKGKMDRLFETVIDPFTGETSRQLKRKPVLIKYTVGGEEASKRPDEQDLDLLEEIRSRPVPESVPRRSYPIEDMYHGSRLAPKGVEDIHELYSPRALRAIGKLWEIVESVDEDRLRNMLLFWADKTTLDMSFQNRYRPSGYSQVGQYQHGVYYLPSESAEISPWYNLRNKLSRIVSAFESIGSRENKNSVSTGNAAKVGLPENSVDFIFTDPPFGKNIPYADLNLTVEAWYGVSTNSGPEAIIDKPKQKGHQEYKNMMKDCLGEFERVLKPGRWMTMVFHNSHNRVWHAIQEALQQAGFVVADVRTLDKKQGSYRQVTSDAAQQDLIISCYKPSKSLSEAFELQAGTEDAAWEFVRNHLDQLPVFVGGDGQAETIAERLPYLLYDRMVAFHVQRGVTVPLSNAEFREGLAKRFAERDGMCFLPSQTAEYDRKRMEAQDMKQLTLVVKDEQSAIQWLRQTLDEMPQDAQSLHPKFTQEMVGWDKHEEPLELRTLLEENFLKYDGTGLVPEQIREALQREHPELGDLDADDDRLQEEAKSRWYVPDPGKAEDVEKMRRKELLKAFEEYRASDAKTLKTFRSEAVRAGFKDAWQRNDYRAILEVARKIKDDVLEEDPKLLMYRDQAKMRVEDFDQTDGLPLFEE